MIKFSIVVPTYNEEKDIADTLNCLIMLEWSNFEVIVVDDSNDRTPEIVQEYSPKGVRLIRPEKRGGRCEARNMGIMEASGDVVVVLNADVHLPPSFLADIAKHYDNGADYVLVKSEVENTDHLYARYVDAVSTYQFYGEKPRRMEWTEGFSCRRSLAICAGLFPTGYGLPICAGEDGIFGDKLRELGAKKHVDLNIVCTHIAPQSFSEYWHIRKGRGQGSPQVRYFLENWTLPRIAGRALLRCLKTMVMSVTFLPVIFINARYAKKSAKGYRDIIFFSWAWMIEQIAFSAGEWQSVFQIRKYIKQKSK